MISRIPPDCCVAEFSSLVTVTNADVAAHLNEIADLLETQRANPFRVQAYRSGADSLLRLRESVQEIFDAEDVPALIQIQGIGKSIATIIEQILRAGHSTVLDRLRGEAMAERTFATVPGIGTELAARIHEQLGIDTVEELETAAHNGTLQRVSGMGPRRVLAVRESLAGRFLRHRQQDSESLFEILSANNQAHDKVTVADILSVDLEYRQKETDGQLIRIAPRRFNPQGKKWLPILHTERHDQHFTAVYSNSARAHQLGRTHDWVIVHHDDEDHAQWTIVTQHRGRLNGKRVVRGRERECDVLYRTSLSRR